MATLTCLKGPNLEWYTLCYYFNYLFYLFILFIYLFYLLFYLFILFIYLFYLLFYLFISYLFQSTVVIDYTLTTDNS